MDKIRLVECEKPLKFTRIGFILAAAGSAVGLGNVWKFPYMTGVNGGGAFVLIYLCTILFIGVSIFMAEVLLGRLGESDSISSFEKTAASHPKLWRKAGFLVITGILVISFYLVVVGWILKYITLSFSALPQTAKASGEVFGNLLSQNIGEQFFYFTVAFLISFAIVAKGVKSGIERLNLWLMPLLIFLLIIMVLYSMSFDGFSRAVEFLFVPDWSKISWKVVLSAIGHAFFTLSIGLTCIATYAASQSKDTNIFRSSLAVAGLDTIIAFLAGLVIFTFIFQFNAEPSAGPGLVFVSLPTLFSNLDLAGNIMAFAFFVTLAFAGFTSSVSMTEPLTLVLTSRFKISRMKALAIIAAIVYILGSFALLSQTKDYKEFATFFGVGSFDILDFLSSSILMPIGGIIIALFIGFFAKRELVENTMKTYMNNTVYNIWLFSIRFIAPIAVLVVMYNLLVEFFSK